MHQFFTLFPYNASTCFGPICSPSSGGQVYNVAMVLVLQSATATLDTPLTTVSRYVTAAVIYMSGGIQPPAGLTAWLLDRFSFAWATTTPKPSECNQQFQGHRTLRTTNCRNTLNYRRSSKLIRTCPVVISPVQKHYPSLQAHIQLPANTLSGTKPHTARHPDGVFGIVRKPWVRRSRDRGSIPDRDNSLQLTVLKWKGVPNQYLRELNNTPKPYKPMAVRCSCAPDEGCK
jgi:hypothetical protein